MDPVRERCDRAPGRSEVGPPRGIEHRQLGTGALHDVRRPGRSDGRRSRTGARSADRGRVVAQLVGDLAAQDDGSCRSASRLGCSDTIRSAVAASPAARANLASRRRGARRRPAGKRPACDIAAGRPRQALSRSRGSVPRPGGRRDAGGARSARRPTIPNVARRNAVREGVRDHQEGPQLLGSHRLRGDCRPSQSARDQTAEAGAAAHRLGLGTTVSVILGQPPRDAPARARARDTAAPSPKGTMTQTVAHVVGARPNFMKAAPVIRALAARGVAQRVVHTGQHYDATMSDVFFRELGLPEPDVNLGVGSGSHAGQTAALMVALERTSSPRPPGARRRLRRRQLDGRGGARRGQARAPDRARRGRPAQLRRHDARGDQPPRHGPALATSCS